MVLILKQGSFYIDNADDIVSIPVKKRAIRRYHLKRMKIRALNLYPYPGGIKYANNLCACSCYGCANDRKFWGPTVQEKRQIDNV